MTALLTDNLPLLAGAPNGIKKLRELILELAVRGKLVPQDPSDEPASELLKRIAEEKARLVAEGKIKKQKPLAELADEERPFELPQSWEWRRISELLPEFQNGASSRGDADGLPVTVLRLADIRAGEISLDDTRTLVLSETTIRKYTLEDGDILLIRVNGSADLVGRFVVCRANLQAIPCDHFIRMRFSRGLVDSAYLKLVGDSDIARSAIAGLFVSTAGQKTVNQGHIGSLSVPFPPLAEQHRIVAKVDELMALCDRLEARQADAESAHAQLVQALLDSLTQAQDAEDFAQSWQRLAEFFHTLFTTESSIEALKQTLLQLAVRGRLVPQIPEEKEAINWLESIQLEKQRLQHNRLRQNINSATGIEIETPATELPESWHWVSLADITLGMDSGWSPACEPTPSPSDSVWGVLKTTAVQVLQYLEGENKELPAHLEPRPDAEVRAGDILFTRAGPTNRVGVSCLVESTRPRLMISDKIIRFHPVEVGAYGRYIALCLNTGATAMYLELAKSGMAASQVNISQEKLKRAPIPFPPLPEQHRIVAKVDQLMSLCDQLKARLNLARQVHEQLASALVEQAVA
ncbi:restriction endonuclease subunit S [Pseudomonas sp. NCHU5208]|uniref:restriction endonuclease subunit S n=1 Tax=unclassified Pseudomonas TaxID=196821 RepID=UPI003F9888D8